MREARQHDNSDIKNKDNKHLICICDEKKKKLHIQGTSKLHLAYWKHLVHVSE